MIEYIVTGFHDTYLGKKTKALPWLCARFYEWKKKDLKVYNTHRFGTEYANTK